jgi:hypothetical protein
VGPFDGLDLTDAEHEETNGWIRERPS